MKKHYKTIGIIFFILGVISMLLLLAKGFNFYQIDNTHTLGALVFIAIFFPALGIKFIKKNK